MSRDYDVIIVGGGGAGLSAAISAHDAGASCMVLEADSKLGGATMLAGGVFYAAGTSVQRKAGIVDDANAMFDYMMCLNQWEMNPELIRILADQSAPALEWLISIGTEFPHEWLVCSGAETIARGHPSRGAGGSIAEALVNAAGSRGIDFALNTRVESLMVEEDFVVGVRAEGMELRAGAIVITTGGFGNSPKMLKRFYPTAYSHGERTYAVHKAAPFILGDGLVMAERIGADIVGQDTGLLLPASGNAQVIESELPPWIMLVNLEGRRFMDETAPYSVAGYIMNHQTHRRTFAIFDEPTLIKASNDTRYTDPYHSGVPIPTWEERTIREQLAKGRIKSADSLEALAKHFGIDGIALKVTADRYSSDCEQGIDSQFFKKMDERFPIRKPPFYAVEVRASTIGLTGCGLNIDATARVLNEHLQPISGLYAAGEVLGCIQGRRYVGGGIGIANSIVFGRIAGKSAAVRAKTAVEAVYA